MVYRLKIVRYKEKDRRILLQNENGPCPLLAAANALLLQGNCTLPPASVRNGVASLQDVTNMLAEYAMQHNHGEDASFYVNELVQYIPKFQYGMDVNPTFTQGATGYEYTAQLTAFDMMRCKLVHGWLVDVHDEETFRALGTKTYNQLVEDVIRAQEAASDIERLQQEILLLDSSADPSQKQQLPQMQAKLGELQDAAHKSMLVKHFLESTGHQLTHYGLLQLHDHLEINEICVFFRNNHFGTLTKHSDGHLYLLVTDLGYANSPAVVWERLDVIDGDTDYVNSEFRAAGAQERLLADGPTLSPEQMLAASSQKDADYQLALQLSKGQQAQQQDALDDQDGRIMAAATEASLREYHGISSPTENATAAMAAASISQPSQNPQHIDIGVPMTKPPPPNSSAVSHQELMDTAGSQMDADRLLALQLQEEDHAHDDAALARRLQAEENQRRQNPSAQPPRRGTAPAAAATAASSSSKGSGCVIS